MLDNGPRGCTASAKMLGQYTGLSERTVEKYRAELADRGLVYRVTGTRGWHVNLPTGVPPDRATDNEILHYAQRIVEVAGWPESTPTVAPESTPTGAPVRPAVGESTPRGVDKYAQHRTDTTPESTPPGGESVVTTITTPTTGLMSTQETHDKSTHEYEASLLIETHEKGVSQDGDGKESVQEILERIESRMTVPQQETVDERKEKWRRAARGAS